MDDALIVIGIRGTPELVEFSTIEQLEEWLDKEVNFWKWVQITAQDGNLHPMWNDMANNFTQVRSLIQGYRERDEAKRPSFAKQISQVLTQLYSAPYALISSAAKAQFAENMRQKDPQLAAYVLWGFLKRKERLQYFDTNAIRGVALATIFDAGGDERNGRGPSHCADTC